MQGGRLDTFICTSIHVYVCINIDVCFYALPGADTALACPRLPEPRPPPRKCLRAPPANHSTQPTAPRRPCRLAARGAQPAQVTQPEQLCGHTQACWRSFVVLLSSAFCLLHFMSTHWPVQSKARGGGGPAKFWSEGVGGGKSEDSLWRRDLSALGPFGAEANLLTTSRNSGLLHVHAWPPHGARLVKAQGITGLMATVCVCGSECLCVWGCAWGRVGA